MKLLLIFLIPILWVLKTISDVTRWTSEKFESWYTGLMRKAEKMAGRPHPPTDEDILAVLTDGEKEILTQRREEDSASLLKYVKEEEVDGVLRRAGWN